MFILISTLLAGLVFSLALFGMVKFFDARKKGTAVGGLLATAEENLRDLTALIEQALTHAESMMPLDDLRACENEISQLQQSLSEEQEKLQKLDKQVEKLQKTVEAEESAHNGLKKGREEATVLAEQLRANHDQLDNEQKHLQDELNQSLSELDALNTEVELTNEQQMAFDRVYGALENAQTQVVTLSDIYTQSYSRFTNLEGQYAELEREFTKLVEKELGNG